MIKFCKQSYKFSDKEEWSETLEKILKKKILSITFQVTENCCMACTYCYQHNKTIKVMNWETAKIAIDQIFSYFPSDDYGGLILDFIGGEPLMEIDLIDQICDYILNIMIEKHSPWLPYFICSICSNGLLYNSLKVQNFFKKYNYFINFSISIDGNQELHDLCRLDLNGNPTYNKIITAIRHYRINYKPLIDTKMTLSPTNVKYTSAALINLIKEGYKYIYCNCIFEKGWDYSHAKILYNELKIIGNYLLDNNLYDKIFIRFFDEDLYNPLDENDNTNFCGGICKTDSKQIYYSIKYNGQIFPCIRYMNSSLNNKQPELPIGDIWSSPQDNKYQQNINLLSNITRKSQSTDECFYCPIAKGCAWCSGYNYEEFGTPNKRATYICCMHQAVSLANVYYWNKLYQKLNINKIFKMYLPKRKALNIINEEEYNYLQILTKKRGKNE